MLEAHIGRLFILWEAQMGIDNASLRYLHWESRSWVRSKN